jgi:hypothetical protein
MKSAYLLLSVVLGGCGRIGFDITRGGDNASGDNAPGDDTQPGGDAGEDAAIDASTVGGAWTLLHDIASGNPLAFPPTTAGSLIVVMGGPGPMTVTDNGNNTYVNAGHADLAMTGESLELWYTTNASEGVTQIDGGASATFLAVWEVGGIEPITALDMIRIASDQPASTAPLGAAVTTTRSGDFVVTGIIGASTINGLATGSTDFTRDSLVQANGLGHLTDTSPPIGTYQPQWDQFMSAGSCSITAAFFTQP